jgi:phosphoribosylanthranilate isomerase
VDRSPPRVKICGVTNLADAELAVELGAWAVGLIFYPRSPRHCPPTEAERISAALRRQVNLVGVFVNPTLEQVDQINERVDLAMLQLHGDEGPAFCAESARRTGARVIKAERIAARSDLQDLERFHTDFHLVDGRGRGAAVELRGGTGEPFDWTLLSHRRSNIPLILSGGLNPANVAEAIRSTHPYAVDSASGTESEPGRKDPERMRAFFDQVRQSAPAPAAAGDPAPERRADLAPDTEPILAPDAAPAPGLAG